MDAKRGGVLLRVEDALWFVFNPAFGWRALTPERATWHPHWLLGVPVDYWVFAIVGGALLVWSYRGERPAGSTGP